jgi:hypothetical protein
VTSSASATSTPVSQNNRRVINRDTSQTQSPSASVTNGILYDPSSTPTLVPSATATASKPAETENFIVTQEVLDFARVAVLYVLQQKQLDNAASAQTAIQSFFDTTAFTNRAAMNVSLGNGNSINLFGFSLDLGDGQPVGANVAATTPSPLPSTPRRSVHKRNRTLWSSLYQ